jgi:hypothetical protein
VVFPLKEFIRDAFGYHGAAVVQFPVEQASGTGEPVLSVVRIV